MKKMIITMMTTITVMTVACGAYIAGVKSDYETKLAEANTTYEQRVEYFMDQKNELTQENYDLTDRVKELESVVYNMRTGNAYDVTIDHDDSTYRFVTH